MPVITLPDGSQRQFEQAVTIMDVAADIGHGTQAGNHHQREPHQEDAPRLPSLREHVCRTRQRLRKVG